MSLGFQADYKQYEQDSYFGLNQYDISQKTIYLNALFKSIIGNTNHTFTTGVNSITDIITERVGATSRFRTPSGRGAWILPTGPGLR